MILPCLSIFEKLAYLSGVAIVLHVDPPKKLRRLLEPCVDHIFDAVSFVYPIDDETIHRLTLARGHLHSDQL